MHNCMVKIIEWRLKLTGSDADCKKTDGIWRVTVPATMSISTLAFKALLLCRDTEKCPSGCRPLNSEESGVDGLKMG